MQITENTELALRIAVIPLARDEDSPSFTLFPMIHLGEREFYEGILGELQKHDLLICESGAGQASRWLSQAYRQAARNLSFGLVLQSAVLNRRRVTIPVRPADLSAAESDRLWREVPLLSRLGWRLGALGFGLLWRYYGSRYAMRQLTSTQDRQVDEEGARDLEKLQRAREGVLLAALDAAIAEGPKRVAVLYGAGHMPVVIKHLMDARSYQVAGKASWRTVVAY